MMKEVLLTLVAVACLQGVRSQCTHESLQNRTLVATLLARSLEADRGSGATVTVTAHTVVCLAVNTNINEYREASLVVQYDCTGNGCPGSSGVVTQVEFGCSTTMGVWSEEVSNAQEGNVQTPPAQADLMTSLRSDCANCLHPTREGNSDQLNHCISCDSSCVGLGMCTARDASGCCNVEVTGQCRAFCPTGTIRDPNFVCRANCTDPLPAALYQRGVLDNPNCSYVGCAATYTCDEPLTLVSGMRTYQLSCEEVPNNPFAANWDMDTQICSQRCDFVHDADAEARGIEITYEPSGCESMFDPIDCVANYTHNSERASCSCTRDGTSGVITCFSESVTNLTIDIPIITTTMAPGSGLTGNLRLVVIIVPVVGGVVLLIVAVVILSLITCCCCKPKGKKSDEVQLSEKKPKALENSYS